MAKDNTITRRVVPKPDQNRSALTFAVRVPV